MYPNYSQRKDIEDKEKWFSLEVFRTEYKIHIQSDQNSSISTTY